MLTLLEQGAPDEAALCRIAAPMSGEELEHAAEERALAGKCGNPLCSRPWTFQQPKAWWNATTLLNYEPPRSSFYCCDACEAAVLMYARQLGDPMKRLKPSVRQMLAPSHGTKRPGMEGVAAQGGGVTTMLAEVKERDPEVTAAEAEAAGKALQEMARQGAAAAEAGAAGDATGSAKAVEGYVPVAARREQQEGEGSKDAGAGQGDAAACPSAASSSPWGNAAAAAAEAADAVASQSSPFCQKAEGSELQLQGSDTSSNSSSSSGGNGSTAGAQAGPTAWSELAIANSNSSSVSSGSLDSEEARDAEGRRCSSASGGSGQRALRSSLKKSGSSRSTRSGASETGSTEPAKTVRFAPEVEYQLPPRRRKHHSSPGEGVPVLLFSMDPQSGAGERVALPPHKGPAIAYGTLQVASGLTVDDAKRDFSHPDRDASSSRGDVARPPAAMKLWFPLAAGGLGVAIRQAPVHPAMRMPSVQHPAMRITPAAPAAAAPAPTTADSKAAATAPSSSSAAPVQAGAAPSEQPSSAVAGAAAAGDAAASAACSQPVKPAPQQPAACSSSAAEGALGQPADDNSATVTSAARGASGAPFAEALEQPSMVCTIIPPASAQAAKPAAQASGLRKFLPSAPARRRVQYVDTPLTAVAATGAASAPSTPVQAVSSPNAGNGSLSPLASSAAAEEMVVPVTQDSAPATTAGRPARPVASPYDDDGAAPCGSQVTRNGKVHVVRVPSSNPNRGGAAPGALPPGTDLYFSDEEGCGSQDDGSDAGDGQRGLADGEGWDPDEYADALFAGSMRPAGEESEEEEDEQREVVEGRRQQWPRQSVQRRPVQAPHQAARAPVTRQDPAPQLQEQPAPATAVASCDASNKPAAGLQRCSQHPCGSQWRQAATRSQDGSSASGSEASSPRAAPDAQLAHQQQPPAEPKARTPNPDATAAAAAAAPSKQPAAGSATASMESDAADWAAGVLWRDDLDSSDEEGAGGSSDETASSASGASQDLNYKSMMPFFQKRTGRCQLVLSPFNEVQLALCGWVNHRTVAFVNGVGLGPVSQPGAAVADHEYADEAGLDATPSAGTVAVRVALMQLMGPYWKEVCSALAVRAPESDVSRKLTALLCTFRFSGPVPAFKRNQWHLLSLALLHALSVHHLPALRSALHTAGSKPGARGLDVASTGPALLSLLRQAGFDVHYLRVLVDLLSCPEL